MGAKGALTPRGNLSSWYTYSKRARMLHSGPSTSQGGRSKAFHHVTAQLDRQGKERKQGLWTAVDLTATLGSVGGAVAFVLTQEAMLVGLPVVLPLLALYASRKREKAVLEVC